MAISYNSGTNSTIGPNVTTKHLARKAIQEAQDTIYFGSIASVEGMPKNFGKTISKLAYMPLIDDRNTNTSEGLDAAGAVSAGASNLYGSSKDIGTIQSSLPTLSEGAGRVNRVGFTRVERTATLSRLGFFYEWTDESVDFDNDAQLYDHTFTELVNGAVKVEEHLLQIDLVSGAGVVRYAGGATSLATVTAEGATADLFTYEDIARLDIALTMNKAPKTLKVLTGSATIDTRTVPNARVLYVSPELQLVIEGMKNANGREMFIPVHTYSGQTKPLVGEIGSISGFRVVSNVEMLKHAGVGASVTTNPGYRATSGKYDVYNMLAVAGNSFVTVGFQGTVASGPKFQVFVQKPGEKSVTDTNPYGNKGLASIQWFHATLIERPEWIGLLRGVAPV